MKKLAFLIPLAFMACSETTEVAPVSDGGASITPDADGGIIERPDATAVTDGGRTTDATTDAEAGATCTAAREQLLKPIDAVSTGAVDVLATNGAVRTVYVDASAGGTAAASTNPRVYLSLDTAAKANVTDETAPTSTGWDLALKRAVLFTNSGDGGSGQGGAVLVTKSFESVTAADASGKVFAAESFFEPDCTAKVDATGAVKTSFDGWYDYDMATNGLSPRAGTWLVKGATGKLFKLRIVSYYATPEGGVGQAGGRYQLEVGAL